MRLTSHQKKNLWGLAFAAPAMLFFLAFSLIPIARTFYISFFDYDLLNPAVWVGTNNYERFFSDARAQSALLNSFRYVITTYIPVWFIALVLALALNSRIPGRTALRVVYFIPVVMSWVVVSVIWKLIFHRNGLANSMFLGPFGIEPINWLTDSSFAMNAVVIMSVWKEVGFFMVIFLAGLQGIPPELQEASRVDGASGWNVFRTITLPLLQPTILFATVIGLITGLQIFIPQYIMTQGGPSNATLVLTLDIYQTAFQFLDMGRAAATSVILCLIIGAITLLQFRLYRSRVN